MKHTFQSHSSTTNFRFTCGISGCVQTFRTYSAITSHLQRKHPDCEFSELFPNTTCTDITEDLDEDTNSDDDNNSKFPENNGETSEQMLSKKSTALVLLNLKERHHLTQTAINFSIGQITQ